MDGHDFAAEAVVRGAEVLLVERLLPLEVPQVLVPSVREAMGPISAAFYGHPAERLTMVGVTGTNGKTTTSRLAAAIACAHGLPTGLYTSPHLLSVTERMQVCGEPIAEADFADEYERLLPFLTTVDQRVGQVTYFEAITTLGLLWFADKPVDLAVVEVGMGGTWDATNLVDGDVVTQVAAPVVEAIERAGVKRITGDLVADATWFQSLPNGAGWTADDLNDYYGAEISAISLEQNYAGLRVTPASAAGQPCLVEWLQPHTGLNVDNRVVTGAADAARRITPVRVQIGRAHV